jgi:hypothetical protein
MSGSAGRSSEHKHSHSSSTGNDSDSSFSADFDDLQMQTRNVVGDRLKEADFGDIKGVWASVVIGEVFSADDEYELTWENETTEMQLTWSGNCNLEGQEGIASSSGDGWAGWDDTEKCYLNYNTGIDDNEYCMRIVEIEVVSKPKLKPKPKRKADRKTERSARKKAKAAKSGSDSEDNNTVRSCSYVMVKGKLIGLVCGKKMETMTDEGHPLCKKHAKSHAKKVAKAKVKEALVSALSDLDSTSESEVNEPANVDHKTTADSDDDIISDQCVYEFTKGKSKGGTCGKSTTTGSDMCSKHKAAADKKATSGDQSKKIENSDRKGEKSSDMADSTQTKNMSTALLEVLTEILTGALNDKYAAKAIAALHTDEAHARLTEVIKTNMPTKVVRSKRGKRRKKDPAAPKRGCSSYIFFCKHNRSDVKDDNPDMKGTDVTRELGRIWREETSDKNKKRYIKEATEDKERYLEEMKYYTPSAEWLAEAEASDSDDGKKKRKKSTRKPGPKRARSSYIYFCTDMRSKVKEDNEDMDAKEVTAELGRLWREEYKEDADLNKKYTKQAKKDKKRFETEKAEWVDPEPSDESFAPEPKKSKKRSKKSNTADSADDDKKEYDSSDDKKASEPTKKKSSKKKSSKKKSSKKKSSKKAALTGFISFCQQTRKSMREENTDWTMTKVTKEMERLWASMDSDEQSAYNSK